MIISRGEIRQIIAIASTVLVFAGTFGLGSSAIPLNPIDQALGQTNAKAGNAADRWFVQEDQDSGELWVMVHELDRRESLTVELSDSTGILDLADSSLSLGTIVVHTAITPNSGPYTILVKSQDEMPTSYAITTFTSSAVSVIVLEPSDQSTSASTSLLDRALSSLGIKAQVVVTVEDFISKLGNDPSLAIICGYAGSAEAYTSALKDYLADGGTCIIYDSHLSGDEPLLQLMDATYTGTEERALFLHLIIGYSLKDLQNSPLFILKNYLPLSLGLDRINATQPGADSYAVATIDGVLGDAGVLLSHDGQAILNSFLPEDIQDKDDALALIENEIIYACIAETAMREWLSLPWWNRYSFTKGASYVRQAKYVYASTLLQRAVLELIPNSPWWDASDFDFIPTDQADLPQYLDRARGLTSFSIRITDLTIIEGEFFNLVMSDIDPLEDFIANVPPAVETLRAWLPGFAEALHYAEETGIGVFLLPPAPIFSRIYPSEITPLAQMELVNYTDQTQSLTLSASVNPSLVTSVERMYSVSPRSTKHISIAPEAGRNDPIGPAYVYLTLKVNGSPYYTVPLNFLPDDEFPLGTGNYAYLVKWITPNITAVTDFSSTAIESLQTASRKDPDEIARLLWNSLQTQGFEYLDMLPSSTSWSQRIRTPEESLQDNGGNCMETSLLIASLLKAAGVDPYIVIIPSEQHAMAGWRAMDGSLHFIEGTFLDGVTTFDLARLWGTKTWNQYAQSAARIDSLSSINQDSPAFLLDVSALLESGETENQ